MNAKMNKYHQKYAGKYTLAFDLGVASVGMAAIDENYHPLIYKNQEVFATKLFNEAHNAETRRLARGVRRGYRRRMRRLQLLQELFAPLIKNIDNEFFSEDVSNNKWKNSNNFDNRTLSEVLISLGKAPNSIPTIYHLRKELLESNEKIDLRLVYLAIHHIIKYRGHFLNSGGLGSNDDVRLSDIIFRLNDSKISLNDENEIMLILEDNMTTKRDKKNLIMKILKPIFTTNSQLNAFSSVLTDSKFSLKDLFTNIEIDDDLSINISDEELEEKLSLYDQEVYDIVHDFYSYYLNIQLKHILKDNDYFCESQIELYDRYRNDLDEIKIYIKQEFGREIYNSFFVTSRANLAEYKNHPKIELLCLFDKYNKHASKGEQIFNDSLKKLLSDDKSDYAMSVKLRLDNNDFLVKQRSRRNVAVPYQLNLKELLSILNNQSKFHIEMNDDFINKCEQLIKFRIPYSVGPLAKVGMSDWSWSSRKTKDHKRVTPWTYHDVIDEKQSSADFINRMTNNCTYLVNETVLPKNSLLVQYYEVLNELNGMNYRPNNELRSRVYRLGDLRYDLLEDLFKERKKVTKKQIENWYKKNNEILVNHDFFGFQSNDSFSTSLSSWIDFEKILKKKIYIDTKDFDMVEEIILWLTVYNDKKIVEDLLVEKYGDKLDLNQVKMILSLNYSGWSRLSEMLLNGLTSSDKNSRTIVEIMLSEQMTFMEVYNLKKFGFEKIVNEENALKLTDKIIYEDIVNLVGSPALKRGVWQVVRMYQEMVSLFGDPKIIVLENTRQENIKRRTISREDEWNDLSKSEKNRFWEGLPLDYRNDKHFLYLLQEGRCMYTNEILDFSNLNNYDIDHIIPQTLVKDNSLDNRVLVKSLANMDKSGDKVPLEVVSDKQKFISIWSRLYDKGYISSKKLNNLMRRDISEEERGRFIKRQLVETSQIIKHVTNLLQENVIQQNFDTKVYGLRSKVITDVRRAFNLPKIREIGPQHHAMDAFIAAVVQQFIIEEYGDNIYHSQRFSVAYQNTISGTDGLIVNKLKGLDNTINEKTGSTVHIRELLETMMEKDVILTRMTGTNKDGARFWKETKVSPKLATNKNMVNYSKASVEKQKYGVPTEVNNDFILLVEYIVNEKKYKKMFTVPYDLSNIYKNDLEKISIETLKRNLITSTEIKRSRILRKDQLIQTPKGYVTLTSESEVANFQQFSPSLTLQRRLSELRLLKEDDKKVKQTYDEFINQYYEQFKNTVLFDTKSINSIVDLDIFTKENMKYNEKIDIIPTIQLINELLIAVQPSNSSSSKLKRFGRITRKIDIDNSKVVNVSVTGLNKMYEDM